MDVNDIIGSSIAISYSLFNREEVLTVLNKKEGKIINVEDFISLLHQLEDGTHLVTIKQLRESKTEEEYRAEYFSLVDQVRDHTGMTRAEIHKMNKASVNIETTQGFEISDWVSFIKYFKDNMFLKLDLIL